MRWKLSRRLLRGLGLALAIAAIAAPASQAAPRAFVEGAGVADPPASSVPADSLGRPPLRPAPGDSTSDVEPASSSLDWVYVGLGFVGVGLLLLGGGALIIGRQNRKSRLAAT